MKVIFRLFAALMAIALVGCGSSPAPVQIGLVYVVGQGSNTIQGFSEKSDGEIQALPVSSFNTNPRPVSLAFTPAKDFLYVANFTANTVSGYTVNHTTGVLTPVGEALAPTPVGVQPISVGVDPSGHFLYVLNQGIAPAAGSISVFSMIPEAFLHKFQDRRSPLQPARSTCWCPRLQKLCMWWLVVPVPFPFSVSPQVADWWPRQPHLPARQMQTSPVLPWILKVNSCTRRTLAMAT